MGRRQITGRMDCSGGSRAQQPAAQAGPSQPQPQPQPLAVDSDTPDNNASAGQAGPSQPLPATDAETWWANVVNVNKYRGDQSYTCPLCKIYKHTSAAMIAQHLTVKKYHPNLEEHRGKPLQFYCCRTQYRATGVIGRQTLD
ncbi:hypothetical protein WJX74_009353 [Apatococcus lobatus]|uniref:BED-type domain-containing protein n=1 Tax=Apatococcus lobatus TaxID=904363 RepID=A0AAW1Q2X4_9CHLO